MVVVFGAGPIGLFAAMLSDHVFGASHVVIVEPIARRREFARKWCDHVYGVEEFFEEFPRLTGRKLGCDIKAKVPSHHHFPLIIHNELLHLLVTFDFDALMPGGSLANH